jgi:tetratricopeptide (TPR) repeat protein
MDVWHAISQGQREHAHQMLSSLPEASEALDPDARVLRGACWVQLGSVPAGLGLLQQGLTHLSDPVAGIAGAVLLGQGLFAAALPLLQQAADALPQVAAHAVNLGRCLTLLGRAEDALPHLDRGRAILGDDHSLAMRSKAEALLGLGRIDDALAVLPLQSALDEVVCARASVLGSAGRHDDAAVLLADTLKERPDSQSLLLLAAELAELRGRTGQAVAWLKTALDKDPDNIQLWVQLAQTGRRGTLHPAAQEAATKALQLAEGKEPRLQAMAQVAQGYVLAEGDDSAAAEAAYRKALELAPGLLPALSGLGQLLMQQGQVDEAVRCYEQVRAAAPLQGWSQLIHARQVPEDPAVLAHMEEAARRPSMEGPVHSSMLFTLAAAYEKKKDYDKAIALAAEANAASKKLLPYNPAAHRAQVEREIGFFSQDFMASRRTWGVASALPVFVLGMPRSGTTLTEQILGSHSRIHGAGELGQMGEQISRMQAWEWKLGSGLRYPDCLSDLTATECQQYGQRLLDALQALDPNALRVVDKLPHNFEHVGLIKLLFPNAHIIHVRRDPRDIAISNFFTDYGAKFGGMGFAYDWRWIGEQLVDHDRLMVHWHSVFEGQILEVPYEALVDDTEFWARRMVDFVGMPWEPEVLNYQDLDRPVKTASVWQVRQPVYTTSKERWRRYEAALGELNQALADVPPMPAALPVADIAPGLFAQGMAYLTQGRAAHAETCFRQLLQARPQHASAHQFLGAALLQQGQPAQACEAMRQSVALMPLHASWFSNLALAESAAENTEAAQKAQQIATQLKGG